MTVQLPRGVPHPTGKVSVGDVFWLDTFACYGGNKKPTRPGVVVRAPNPPLFTDARFAVRTSRDEATGVAHGPSPELNLDRPGVFPAHYVRPVDARFLSQSRYATFQGTLDSATLDRILRMLGLS